ncbi:hypothetical protein PF010_g2379 [Phytophthora fragariae]|uniref:Uncharacterized protein n=1 Tax=Phytophthora fragariae TaxID=53985 RepID=A0A6G0PSU7_9STRA|nr:hypothetical protein PF010_g2379 [Phytophthora fragariae]KAE9253878.1 hypothetical protein PF004_g1282 [Phytophthora fragariae]
MSTPYTDSYSRRQVQRLPRVKQTRGSLWTWLLISEEQWIAYFKLANEPSHVDYAVVDEAMKQLRMSTKWPEPESRMMNLQSDLEAILDRFNLAELVFEYEQRRLVRYLTNALEPESFRSVVTTRLTLQENKKFKNEVVPFSTWVKVLLKELMTWEQAANSVSSTPSQHGSIPYSSGRRGGRRGASNSANGGGAQWLQWGWTWRM